MNKMPLKPIKKTIKKNGLSKLMNAIPSFYIHGIISSPTITRFLNIILGVLILVIAHFIAKIVQRSIVALMVKQRSLQSNNNEDKNQESIADRVVGIIFYWVIMMIAAVIVLRSLGIETASIIAVLGSIGFALGLAMQGALGDLTAGILLSMGVGFNVGDVIEVESAYGTVTEFNLLYTTLRASNTQQFIKIPNRLLYGNIMQNHTRNPVRALMLNPVVANMNNNLDNICRRIEERLMTHPKVIKMPPVHAQIGKMDSVSTTLNVRVTIRASDFPTMDNYNLGDDLMREIRSIFSEMRVILPDRINRVNVN
jgi:small conductance mechanosensitive channel